MTSTQTNPYRLKLPRNKATHAGTTALYWGLVRQHHGSRKKMVDFICGIGGYSGRPDRYAIEFNIKDYYSDMSVKNLWKMLCSNEMDVGPDKDLPPEEFTQVKALFWRVHKEHEDHVLAWGLEEAYEDWADSDTPYETFEGTRVEWKWVTEGRSGGHLCMTECEGINLKCSTEDLENKLNERESGGTYEIPAETVRKLFIICVQNTLDFEPRRISEEINYRAAWRLWVSFMEGDVETTVEAYRQRETLSEHAELIYKILNGTTPMLRTVLPGSLINSFKTICQLADISTGE